MSNSRAYSGVTLAMFECVKTTSTKEHGTKYDPADSPSGTATSSGTLWSVLMKFSLDPSTEVLTYTLVKETGFATPEEAWGGIEDTLKGCGWQGAVTSVPDPPAP